MEFYFFFQKQRQFIMCWRFVCCVERLHSRRNRLFVQPRRVREFARRVCGRLVCASLVSRRADRLSVLQRRRWLWSERVSVRRWSRRVCAHIVRRPVFAEEGLSRRARLSVRRPESVWCTGHLRSWRALCVARMSRFVLFIHILLFSFKYFNFLKKIQTSRTASTLGCGCSALGYCSESLSCIAGKCIKSSCDGQLACPCRKVCCFRCFLFFF